MKKYIATLGIGIWQILVYLGLQFYIGAQAQGAADGAYEYLRSVGDMFFGLSLLVAISFGLILIYWLKSANWQQAFFSGLIGNSLNLFLGVYPWPFLIVLLCTPTLVWFIGAKGHAANA
jgi:hypothetical protein